MNTFLKAMVVLVLVIVVPSLVIAPQIIKADMNVLDWLLFSDRAYAKEIEVKAYIITQEQARAAFCDPPQEPVQLDKNELGANNTFLFLQVRNTGEKHAWGTLSCKVPNCHVRIKIPIYDMTSPKNYNSYLIHLGSLSYLPSETGKPKISVEWDKICTK